MFGALRSILSPSARIPARQAIEEAAQGACLVIDVREADELRASGRAKGAMHLPLSQIDQQGNPASGHYNKSLKAAAAKGLPVYVYCASGARSGMAAGKLTAMGHKNVANIGSLHEWAAAGGAVQR
jgi:rhodanese-related sulfurtransferase